MAFQVKNAYIFENFYEHKNIKKIIINIHISAVSYIIKILHIISHKTFEYF